MKRIVIDVINGWMHIRLVGLNDAHKWIYIDRGLDEWMNGYKILWDGWIYGYMIGWNWLINGYKIRWDGWMDRWL